MGLWLTGVFLQPQIQSAQWQAACPGPAAGSPVAVRRPAGDRAAAARAGQASELTSDLRNGSNGNNSGVSLWRGRGTLKCMMPEQSKSSSALMPRAGSL